MTPEQVRWCEERGLSVIVGTADAEHVPSCCRGAAVRSKDDFETLTVYVPVATGQEIVANVATTRRIAVSLSLPRDNTSIQMKGLTTGVRLAPAADEPFVKEYVYGFADILEALGLPRRLTRSMNHWPAFAIDMSVEEVYDQTPGPNAGAPLA
ncbi:MAG: hypothetical protein JO197_04285 [Acidobacteria bacterium]|nr:hypothetical protein [Acidobacteriota bacterium]MBV9476395.1 hypothetical protein [Acidobacteriota bacterium]